MLKISRNFFSKATVAAKYLAGCLLGLLALDAIGAAIINVQSKGAAVLRFAWPTPKVFKVEESVRKGELEWVLLHTLSLQTNNDELYSEYWEDWVENWNEVELKASEETATEAEVSLSPGSQPVPMKFRLKNLGATATNAALLHLQSEYNSDDSKTLQGLKGFVDSLANEISDGRPLDTNGLSKLSISIKREVVANPSGLLPSWGKRERLIEFIDSGKVRRSREVHEYGFFWDVPD